MPCPARLPATAFGPRGQLLSAPGAGLTEGHGWASAQLTPYILVAGCPPASAGDVVIDERLARHGRVWVGARLLVVVPAGTRTFRVSGIAAAGQVVTAASRRRCSSPTP